VSRIPIRLRLTLVFVTAMLLVLGVTGVFVYLRFRAELDRTIDLNLHTQAAALAPLIERSDAGLAGAVQGSLFQGHESFVQILDARGRILAATSGLSRRALLTRAELAGSLRRTQLLTRGSTGPLLEGSRLLTTPVKTPGHGLGVLIVGATLDERASALSNLAVLLALVGPLALIVASVAGYGVASAALRPVELMRRRAGAVTAAEPGRRLPLPPARDEIRRLGATLNDMLDRLEGSLAREKTFVADASHELRTPLATLKMELELALRRERSAEELRQTVRAADEEVDRLSALADDLLVLARSDEGALPVDRVEIRVSELLSSVRDRFDPRHERAQIALADDLRVLGDPERLQQALGGLLDNALRYGAGEISLRAWADERGVELHVQDAGPGFPPDFLDHAFERFTRADPGRGGRGAGLGLSIVRTIARAPGGDAHVANRAGGGADAWIVIPGPSPG
jgi:signal transduction histidine kinase